MSAFERPIWACAFHVTYDMYASLMLSNPTVSPTEYIPVCSPHTPFTDYEAMPNVTEVVLGDVKEKLSYLNDTYILLLVWNNKHI